MPRDGRASNFLASGERMGRAGTTTTVRARGVVIPVAMESRTSDPICPLRGAMSVAGGEARREGIVVTVPVQTFHSMHSE